MNEDQALLAVTLIARRSAMWAHDIICSKSISEGRISEDAVTRFKRDIMEALAILDREQSLPMTLRATDGKIAFALRSVDTKDIEWLRAKLDYSGHGQFWKVVLDELERAMRTDGEDTKR